MSDTVLNALGALSDISLTSTEVEMIAVHIFQMREDHLPGEAQTMLHADLENVIHIDLR